MEEILFTGAAVLDLLSKIDQIKDENLDMKETAEGFQITIGESVYNIVPSEPTDITVESDVVDQVADANLDAYLDMEEDGVINLREFRDDESVEGGPILELIKTLFVGGMVRMGSKAVGKDVGRGLLSEAAKSRRR